MSARLYLQQENNGKQKYDHRGYVNIDPRNCDSTQLLLDSNKDPADRIISATAVVEKARLVTSDKILRRSKQIAIIW